MNDKDVKIGMKVVPFKKTAGFFAPRLKDSATWRRAQEDGQEFLYVIGYDNSRPCWVLSDNEDSHTGDFFNADDFYQYVSMSKIIEDCWIKSYYTYCFRYFYPMPRREFKDMQGNIHFYDECVSIKDTHKYLDDVLSRRDLVGVGTIYKINGVVQQPVDEKNPNIYLFFVDKGSGW
jgi:hypothetical protein